MKKYILSKLERILSFFGFDANKIFSFVNTSKDSIQSLIKYNFLRNRVRYLFFVKKINKNKINLICFGDSHSQIFKYIGDTSSKFNILCNDIRGATCQGIGNPNSKTNSLKIIHSFLGLIHGKNKDIPILFMMGEVDCGFVVWYKSKKYNIPVEDVVDKTLNTYLDFLSQVKNDGFTDIVVCGSHLPTIADGDQIGKVANLRSTVTASQKERTNLTISFNNKLRERCESIGFRYFDIINYLLDKETGVIKEEYKNDDLSDHHIPDHKISDLFEKNLLSN